MVLDEHRLGAFDQDAKSPRLGLVGTRGSTHGNKRRLEASARMTPATRGVRTEAAAERQIVRFYVRRPRAGVRIPVRHHRADADLEQVAETNTAWSIAGMPLCQRRALGLDGGSQNENIDIRPGIELTVLVRRLDSQLLRVKQEVKSSLLQSARRADSWLRLGP
jgi:hypothetical protein